MRRPTLAISLFLALAMFFGWKTWRTVEAPVDAGKPEAVEAPNFSSDAIGMEAPAVRDLTAAVSSIVARPVFRPDRRPYQENSAVLPGRNYEAELSRITLLGVLLLGEQRKAVVTDGTPGRPDSREVAAGDTLPGFTVKEIRTDGVLLEADGRTFLLPLYAGGPKAGGTTAVRTETAPPRPTVAQQPSTVPSPMGGGVAPLPGRVPPTYPGPGGSTRRMRVPGK